MADGIKDKVAILGMGCTKFGERWESYAEDLATEALVECLQDAGIDRNEIQAAYIGTYFEEISMMEVHDCFSITEMVTMEDLHISPKGGAYDDIMGGFYDLDGQVPCQVDGGLKCFGHPIGASGLRMIYAMYEQLLDRVPEVRKVQNPRLGLTHNLGGRPHSNVAAISIVGLD
jgi:acetyl-CoA acetyltransferase